MIQLGALAVELIKGLLVAAITETIKLQGMDYFQRRKIERRVEDATADVVQVLLPFLTNEHVSEDKQYRLVQTCVEELRPLVAKPELLFRGSLNGQRIYEDIYRERALPQVIVEDDVCDIYNLLFPRIAELLCQIPAAVKDWEVHAWSEDYRRLDEIVAQLQALFARVDQLVDAPSKQADEVLGRVRRALAQKIGLQLDLTGLRADRAFSGRLEDFFVHPEILEPADKESGCKDRVVFGTPEESIDCFTRPGNWAIVTGDPGAGKSTWSKWLQREVISTRWSGIGVRVELRQIDVAALPSLHVLVRQAASQHLVEDLTGDRIGVWLDVGQIVFILDGFDEIRPNDRNAILEWIVGLSEAARACPVIVTSRPLTTDHLDQLDGHWRRYVIEPFDEDRIIDYVGRWYAHTPLLCDGTQSVVPENLAQAWQVDPTIGPLTANPLLLSTLLMVHHLDGRLPDGRAELYRRYVDGMLGLWDDRRKVSAGDVDISTDKKRQIMRALATHMFLLGQDQLDEPAVLDFVGSLLCNMRIHLSAESVVANLCERSGLLVGPGVYSFVHKTVGEFLVAETVLQGDQKDPTGRRIDRFYIFDFREDDSWNTVTFLWAGLVPLADLETFAQNCIRGKALGLAGGIIKDQWTRIPVDMQRRLLLVLLDSMKGMTLGGNSSWYISCPTSANTCGRLRIPSISLRGVVRNELTGLIGLALQDGVLSWADGTDLSGDILDLLWMCSVIRTDDIELWANCLRAESPDKAHEVWWHYWVATCIFRRVAITDDFSKADALLSIYQSVCTGARNLLPFALMSLFIEIYHDTDGSSEKMPHGLQVLLKLIRSLAVYEIPQNLLQDTKSYDLLCFPTPVDLLTEFSKLVKDLISNDKLPDDEICERTIGYAVDLQLLRDSL